MKLQFTSGTKDVPTKQTITRRLLTATAHAVEALRNAGRNKALQVAISDNPAAIGYLTGDWIAEKRRAYQEAYPEKGEAFINEQVQKALAAALTEEFPDVFRAMTNPMTEIDFNDDEAVDAACKLCRVILDTDQLTTVEITELDSVGFWDEQDLEEVVATVNNFRNRAKL